MVINVIDLQELNYKDKIIVDENVVIPNSYFANTDIISLNDIKVSGLITCDLEYNYLIDFEVTGTMILHDSVTYEERPYDFETKIEETLENSCKTLDLIEFLWHYIILEVPMRFTNSDVSTIETENYRVISEEEYIKKNKSFSDFFEN